MSKLVIFLFLTITILNGQNPIEHFQRTDFYITSYQQFAQKKKIPEAIKAQALIALSYFHELKNTRICFRFRKRKTPLTSRPRISSFFLPKKWRSYVITISSKANGKFSPILFNKLPFNAQIGVLGHEIAHIPYYRDRTSLQLLGLGFKLGNDNFVDAFEFNTDKAVIDRGLGHQLYAWSVFVRKALGVNTWRGASNVLEEGNQPNVRERYMNPETILTYMDSLDVYRHIKSSTY